MSTYPNRYKEQSSTQRHGHTHGSRPPFRIRCGSNEGLCVRNNESQVTEMFTDGLNGCTQVIFRNSTATFVCHLFVSAPDPGGWIVWALDEFEREYGRVTKCYVVTGLPVGFGDTLFNILSGRIGDSTRVEGCGGYSINIESGDVRKTPSTWNAGEHSVGGWTTTSRLIDLRLRGSTSLGRADVGDFYEPCRACNE